MNSRSIIRYRVFLLIVICITVLCGVGLFSISSTQKFYNVSKLPSRLFEVQSIDTMKYSRDKAREMLNNPSEYALIDEQMKLISNSGATHVAIDTPYDKEFIPVLYQWVSSARKHNLSVWYRGNFSGWEGWFDYERISRADHKKKLKDFINTNPGLFKNGDIFTACPECENGGPGDPRNTGDKIGFNSFLVDEFVILKKTFEDLGIQVSLYPSMNADIARYVLDVKTAQALGGTVLVDHYVSTPEKFVNDIETISNVLHAKIGIGEFGAPVLDLNGSMSQEDQALYIQKIFDLLYERVGMVPVINYWTLTGGSTALASDRGNPKMVYSVVQSYFTLPKITGFVTDPFDELLGNVQIHIDGVINNFSTDENGEFGILLKNNVKNIVFSREGYGTTTLDLTEPITGHTIKQIVMEPTKQSLWYTFKSLIYSFVK